MFEQLTNRFAEITKNLRGMGKITEKNISDTMRSVRQTLLEADVNYKVAKEFTESIKTKAMGSTVTKSVTPGQQIVKIINVVVGYAVRAGLFMLPMLVHQVCEPRNIAFFQACLDPDA